jgi:MFS family permease
MATYESAVEKSVASADVDAKRRTAIKGAFLTEFIDMFDIYLPVVVLTPVLAYFQPAHIEPGLAAILDSFVFITTLLGRPVGAFIFGRVADRIGRRTSSIISVVGFGIFTHSCRAIRRSALRPICCSCCFASWTASALGAATRRAIRWRWNTRTRASAASSAV